MNIRDYFIISAIALLGFIAITAFVYERIKLRYLARRATNICDAQNGQLVLKGKVQKFDKLMSAPLSKELCCGYLYLVVDRNLETIVHSENQGTDFILDDGTGRCLIRAKLAGHFYNAKLWPPTIKFSNCATLEKAIMLNDLSTEPKNKRYRYLEYRRQEGELVFVNGSYHIQNNLNLNGLIEDSETAPLKITPAYSGSNIHSSNQSSWLRRILNVLA